MSQQPLTAAEHRIINATLAMSEETAEQAQALAFMARSMVQCSLPHRAVIGNEFTRRNGNFALSIMAPSSIGLPYGVIPRLLLIWLTTEALRTQSRELQLGDTLSEFMASLGMSPTGGRWGSITRLRSQTKRLFASSITAIYDKGSGTAIINQSVADKVILWWDQQRPDQAGLWQSSVILSQPFFDEIINRPVPIDMRAVQALRKSPLALDIYSWLTFRASYLKQPTTIAWPLLAGQFGSNYRQTRDFKAAFLGEFKKVATVYSGIRAEANDDGLCIRPSQTHIPRQARAHRAL